MTVDALLILVRKLERRLASMMSTGGATPGAHGASHSSGGTDPLAADAVANSQLANMAPATIKGRAAGAGTGDPTDLTADQASAVLDTAADPFIRTSAASVTGNVNTRTLTWVFDGGGAEIPTGAGKAFRVPVSGTIIGWFIEGDPANPGAVVIDVWKSSGYPPTNANSITNGNEPEIVAADDEAEDHDLSDWTTTAVAYGDRFIANIDSVTAFTWVVFELIIEVDENIT